MNALATVDHESFINADIHHKWRSVFRGLRLVVPALIALAPLSRAVGQMYRFSAAIGGWSDVDLSFGPGSVGGMETTFGTLNETLYYDSVAQTLRQVGSVSLSPAEVSFSMGTTAGWPGPPPLPSGTAVSTIGDGTGEVEFDSGTQSGISSGGGESFGWTLNLPVNCPCTVVCGGVTNCGTLSYAYGLSLVTTISAAGPTGLDVSEFNASGANEGVVVGDIGGWDVVNGSSDDTYEYSWDLSSVVATETPEPDGLMFLGLGAAMVALGRWQRDGGLRRRRGIGQRDPADRMLSGTATEASQGVGHNEHQAARFHEP